MVRVMKRHDAKMLLRSLDSVRCDAPYDGLPPEMYEMYLDLGLRNMLSNAPVNKQPCFFNKKHFKKKVKTK